MKKTIFLLIGLILFACKKEQTDSLRNKDLITIDFESSLVDKLKFSQFVDTIEFIPLETTDRNLIAEVRRIIYDDEKYYISVVDIVGVLSESDNPRKYWNKLKQRLKKDGNETVTNCHQLKLKAQDGKYRLTDVVDIEGMFRIIESIPSRNVEPIKQWLAKLGSERIDEVFDPSIAAQRSIDLYLAKGYDENWILKRLKGIQDRKELTDAWQESGITDGK